MRVAAGFLFGCAHNGFLGLYDGWRVDVFL